MDNKNKFQDKSSYKRTDSIIEGSSFTLTSKNNKIAEKMAVVSACIMKKNKEAYRDLANR